MNLGFSSCVSLGEGANLPPSLKIYAFPSDKTLRVVAALEKNQACQWLASFIKPHNAVAKSTVAGWIKQILIMSGINHIPLKFWDHICPKKIVAT